MAAKKKTPAGAKVYQMKITLLGSHIPIWRRFLVKDAVTLDDLHDIVQIVMGWEFSHLYQFYRGRQELPSEARLSQVAPRARAKIYYIYDMGDYWEHEILVEKTLPDHPGLRHPEVLAAEGACPPEDCGGVWGYEELLAAVGDPEHPDHEDMIEWLGEGFDPQAYDLESVNKLLKQVKLTQ
jgi:hypothetical protein